MRFPGWLAKAATAMSFLCGLLNAGEPATAVATITAGFVTAITLTSDGSGYTSEPVVAITGGGRIENHVDYRTFTVRLATDNPTIFGDART